VKLQETDSEDSVTIVAEGENGPERT